MAIVANMHVLLAGMVHAASNSVTVQTEPSATLAQATAYAHLGIRASVVRKSASRVRLGAIVRSPVLVQRGCLVSP